MISKEVLDARIDAAQKFAKLFLNPLFHKEFLLLPGNDSSHEYNNIIVAGPTEKINFTLKRFIAMGEKQASIVSVVNDEVLLRVVNLLEDDNHAFNSEAFDIHDEINVYEWLTEENLYPEGIHCFHGVRIMVSGDIYRKSIEKVFSFPGNSFDS